MSSKYLQTMHADEAMGCLIKARQHAVLKQRDSQTGFTLIELMVVVAIIGILATIAVPLLMTNRMRSYNSAATSDVVNIQKAQTTFYTDWAGFGSSQNAAVPGWDNAGIGLNGPGSPTTGIGAAGRFMPIGLSNGVRLFCNTTGGGQSYSVSSKHVAGNRAYAAESEQTATFLGQDDGGGGLTEAGAPWAALTVGCTPGVDIVDGVTVIGAGFWTAM